jgi:hypothetical protein
MSPVVVARVTIAPTRCGIVDWQNHLFTVDGRAGSGSAASDLRCISVRLSTSVTSARTGRPVLPPRVRSSTGLSDQHHLAARDKDVELTSVARALLSPGHDPVLGAVVVGAVASDS